MIKLFIEFRMSSRLFVFFFLHSTDRMNRQKKGVIGFTAFYWVLLCFTGFHWVSLGFELSINKFYWVLLGFVGFTYFYWVLLGFT